MSTSSKLIAVGLLAAFAASAHADGISNPITGNILGFDGVSNVGGSSGPPPSPCGAGQLDFSDACNTTLLMVMLR